MDGLEQRIPYNGQRPMASNPLGKSSSEPGGILRDTENTTDADSEHTDAESKQTVIHATTKKRKNPSSSNEKGRAGREKKGFVWSRQSPPMSDRLHGETQSQRCEVLLQGSGSTSRTQTSSSSTPASKARGSNAGDPTAGCTKRGTPTCSTSRHSQKAGATTAYPEDAWNTPHSCDATDRKENAWNIPHSCDATDKAYHLCTATPCSKPPKNGSEKS